MRAPLFSVVIPTYNRARDVVNAVRSVLAQTYPDYDLWVVDDGSTDDTEQALAPFAERIRYVQVANGGQAAAWNVGVSRSGGRYLAFLDSDDRWRSDKLSRYAQAIERQPDAGLLYSDVVTVRRDGERLWVQRARDPGRNAYLSLLHGNFVTTSSAVVRRSALEACGEFDVSLRVSADWDMWIRLARAFPLVRVPFAVTEYRALGGDSQTAEAAKGWSGEISRVVDKAFAADPELATHARTIRAQVEYAIGRTQMWQGNRREAATAFGRAVRLSPSSWRAFLYLALIRTHTVGVLPAPLRRALRIPG